MMQPEEPNNLADNNHNQNHDHDHTHDHPRGLRGWIRSLLHLGGHTHHEQKLIADQAFADSKLGIRTVWIALGLLLLTTVIQFLIYLLSGSVALLADTVHNLGDGLNSIPLLIAFYLARRAPTRRYTYGYDRAEDVAGVIIVLSIVFSAGYIFYESFVKLFNPQEIGNVGAIAAAALIGFIGNEAVAIIQIRTGRLIGSAALVTDGLHARTDGLTSLAVLVAAFGVWLGVPIIDPIIGLLIGFVILFITRDAIVAIWYRLMDAIEPEIYEKAAALAAGQVDEHESLMEIRRLRMRWMGHRLHADLDMAIKPELNIAEGHDLAEIIRTRLFEAMPLLTEVLVHLEPWSPDPEDFHHRTSKREPVPRPIEE